MTVFWALGMQLSTKSTKSIILSNDTIFLMDAKTYGEQVRSEASGTETGWHPRAGLAEGPTC